MSTAGKVGLGVLAVVLVAFVAEPMLRRTRISGNEASAIGSLRAIGSAQATYAATVCPNGFSPTLAKLAEAGVISPDLSSDPSQKAGYIVELRGTGTPLGQAGAVTSPACSDAVPEFRATAMPAEPGSTGVRYFSTDQTLRVFQADNPAFTGATPLE